MTINNSMHVIDMYDSPRAVLVYNMTLNIVGHCIATEALIQENCRLQEECAWVGVVIIEWG